MGKPNGLKFFIIAGILGSAAAGRAASSYYRNTPSTSKLFGFVNTTYEDIENFDVKLCERNGGPKAHDTQKEAFDRFGNCVISVYIGAAIEEESVSLTSDSEIDQPFEKLHCRRISSYENCLKNLTDTIKLCLDPEKHEGANILYDSVSQVVRYLCKDDGAAIAMMNTAVNNTCVRSKEPTLSTCVNQTVVPYLHQHVPDKAAVGGLATLHLLVPDFTKCDVFEKFRHCIVNELKSCSDQTAGNVVDSMLKIVKEVARCDHLLKSQASRVSFANVLSIAGLMGITLRFV